MGRKGVTVSDKTSTEAPDNIIIEEGDTITKGKFTDVGDYATGCFNRAALILINTETELGTVERQLALFESKKRLLLEQKIRLMGEISAYQEIIRVTQGG